MTYTNRKTPIDAGYRSPEVEISNFGMLPFVNNPVDHRAWIIEAKARSITG